MWAISAWGGLFGDFSSKQTLVSVVINGTSNQITVDFQFWNHGYEEEVTQHLSNDEIKVNHKFCYQMLLPCANEGEIKIFSDEIQLKLQSKMEVRFASLDATVWKSIIFLTYLIKKTKIRWLTSKYSTNDDYLHALHDQWNKPDSKGCTQ